MGLNSWLEQRALEARTSLLSSLAELKAEEIGRYAKSFVPAERVYDMLPGLYGEETAALVLTTETLLVIRIRMSAGGSLKGFSRIRMLDLTELNPRRTEFGGFPINARRSPNWTLWIGGGEGTLLTFDCDEGIAYRRFLAALEERHAAVHARPAAPAHAAPAPVRFTPPPVRAIRTWQDAEDFAAEYIRWLGWSDAQATRRTGDKGIDVAGGTEGDLVVAQVKMEVSPVESKVVRDLRGAAFRAKHAMMFSLAGYKKPAIDWADEFDVALFQFDYAGGITPVNAHAQQLADMGGRGT